jgi:hypothetical protein
MILFDRGQEKAFRGCKALQTLSISNLIDGGYVPTAFEAGFASIMSVSGRCARRLPLLNQIPPLHSHCADLKIPVRSAQMPNTRLCLKNGWRLKRGGAASKMTGGSRPKYATQDYSFIELHLNWFTTSALTHLISIKHSIYGRLHLRHTARYEPLNIGDRAHSAKPNGQRSHRLSPVGRALLEVSRCPAAAPASAPRWVRAPPESGPP